MWRVASLISAFAYFLIVTGCETGRAVGSGGSCGQAPHPCQITLTELLDDSDTYAGRFVMFRARIHDSGVHGMFLTDVDNSLVGIPLAVINDVKRIRRFDELIRLLAEDAAAESRVVGTVKGVERYGSDGSRVFELHDLRDLQLQASRNHVRR